METRDSSAVRGDRIELLESLLREVIDLPLISNDGINLKYRIKAVLAGGKDATQAVQSGPDVAGATPAVAAPSEEKFIDPITKAFIDGWVACKNNPDPGPLELYELACAYKGDEYVSLPWSPEETARRFHVAYEVYAPMFGCETQRCSRVPWGELPKNQRALMIAVVRNVLIEQAGKRTVRQDHPTK